MAGRVDNAGSIPALLKRVTSKGITKIEFNNLREFYTFVLDFLSSDSLKGKEHVAHFNHTWWEMVGGNDDKKIFEDVLKKAKGYVIVRGNTKTDRGIAKFYRSHGVKVKTGVNMCGNDSSLYVRGDYIVEFRLSYLLERAIDFAYRIGLSGGAVKSMYDSALRRRTKIEVVITKNPSLAKAVVKRTKKYFKA